MIFKQGNGINTTLNFLSEVLGDDEQTEMNTKLHQMISLLLNITLRRNDARDNYATIKNSIENYTAKDIAAMQRKIGENANNIRQLKRQLADLDG